MTVRAIFYGAQHHYAKLRKNQPCVATVKNPATETVTTLVQDLTCYFKYLRRISIL